MCVHIYIMRNHSLDAILFWNSLYQMNPLLLSSVLLEFSGYKQTAACFLPECAMHEWSLAQAREASFPLKLHEVWDVYCPHVFLPSVFLNSRQNDTVSCDFLACSAKYFYIPLPSLPKT